MNGEEKKCEPGLTPLAQCSAVIHDWVRTLGLQYNIENVQWDEILNCTLLYNSYYSASVGAIWQKSSSPTIGKISAQSSMANGQVIPPVPVHKLSSSSSRVKVLYKDLKVELGWHNHLVAFLNLKWKKVFHCLPWPSMVLHNCNDACLAKPLHIPHLVCT